MNSNNAPNGVIRKRGDEYEVVFVRRLAKPIEKVWAALTVPERIADWFTEMTFTPDVRLGARVTLRFANDDPPYRMAEGEVVAFEPPRLVAWTWPDKDHPNSIVRCELTPDGRGCALTFRQSGMGTKHLTGTAAGWQVFLDGLEGATAGVRTPGSVERERAIRPAYEAQLAQLV
ncbi:MAG: SRPBCC family protein [Caulobacteraceae bacterium]